MLRTSSRFFRQTSRLFRFLHIEGEASENRLDPEQVVEYLDKYIIGQPEAKRAVAIALRNRYRRKQLPIELRREVTPANILLKGPTGCGKTEIARRVSNLSDSPFVKVEATRYTEVGIIGADTKTMVSDLMDVAVNRETERAKKAIRFRAQQMAEDDLQARMGLSGLEFSEFRSKMRNGDYDHEYVSVPVKSANAFSNFGSIFEGLMGGGMNDAQGFSDFLKNMNVNRNSAGQGSGSNFRTATERVTVKEALKRLIDENESNLINREEIINRARESVEQEGIIFIDEIDKLAMARDEKTGVWNKKGEGVQKELLSLLEGSAVSTKYGVIHTDHILFIGSGAFHQTSVSDLMPELQGRLPVRVELSPLVYSDMRRILIEKKFNIVEQTQALLSTEGVQIEFSPEALDEIARVAVLMNDSMENIGARRLNTVMQAVVEEMSFLAHRLSGTKQKIDLEYVSKKLMEGSAGGKAGAVMIEAASKRNDSYSKYIL